jgi:hypothetical protein
MRYDRVCDPGPDPCDDPAISRTMDHGWGVPIVAHVIKAVMDAHPERDISIVAHSFGVTTTRDALRRLQCGGTNPWPRIRTLVFAAGPNHGISTFDYGWCEQHAHLMKGTVVCELGSRAQFEPTDFTRPVNGPDGQHEHPCLDADTAFGYHGACRGRVPSIHTIVMEDPGDGTFLDEFVSEASAALEGADNLAIAPDDFDTSGYFYRSLVGEGLQDFGLMKNHYGAIRSHTAVSRITSWILSD